MANSKARKDEKLVEFTAPRSSPKQHDLYVCINNRRWLIKRGVTVKVPECVAKAAQLQERMMSDICDFQAKNATD